MRDTTERRLKLARGGVLMFVLTLGWTAWQNAGLAPVSAETPSPAIVIAPTTDPVSPLAPIRMEWFSHCDPARDDLGLYAGSDGACSPSRTATLAWLQSQLTMMRVLTEGEYLQRATTRDLPTCGAFIVSADAQVGWICLETDGLYRVDAFGQDAGPRWQLQADGGWLFIHR